MLPTVEMSHFDIKVPFFFFLSDAKEEAVSHKGNKWHHHRPLHPIDLDFPVSLREEYNWK